MAKVAPDHPDADGQVFRNVRQPIRGSLLILRPRKRRIRIVRIAGVAIVVDTIEATEAEASKLAPVGAVAVAKGVGVRLEASSVEAASVEAASSESGASVDAASSESGDAAASDSAASDSAASVEGKPPSESATSVAAAATAGISADRGERQGANHEKSRKGSLERWTHESLSPMYSIDYAVPVRLKFVKSKVKIDRASARLCNSTWRLWRSQSSNPSLRGTPCCFSRDWATSKGVRIRIFLPQSLEKSQTRKSSARPVPATEERGHRNPPIGSSAGAPATVRALTNM